MQPPPPAPPLPFRMNVMKLRDGKQIDTTPRKKNPIDIQLKKEETPNPFMDMKEYEDISQISHDDIYPSEEYSSVSDRLLLLLPEKISTIFYVIFRIFCVFYAFIVEILRRISIRDILVILVGYALYRYMTSTRTESTDDKDTMNTTTTATIDTTTTTTTIMSDLNILKERVSSLESKEIKTELKISSIDTIITEMRKQIESTESSLRDSFSAVESIEERLRSAPVSTPTSPPTTPESVDIALYSNGARIIRSKTSKSAQIKHAGIIGYLNDLLFPAFIPPEIILHSSTKYGGGGYCTNGAVSILLPRRSTIRMLEYDTSDGGVDVYGGYNKEERYLGRISGRVEIEPPVQVDYIQMRTNETMKCLKHLGVYSI